ncbi:hypothetical protein JTB14_011790 [Gonioctena quinquepunctata]|nr:hypothetical protein JTB14_011790 [Gonioctena quinquepunctata]
MCDIDKILKDDKTVKEKWIYKSKQQELCHNHESTRYLHRTEQKQAKREKEATVNINEFRSPYEEEEDNIIEYMDTSLHLRIGKEVAQIHQEQKNSQYHQRVKKTGKPLKEPEKQFK